MRSILLAYRALELYARKGRLFEMNNPSILLSLLLLPPPQKQTTKHTTSNDRSSRRESPRVHLWLRDLAVVSVGRIVDTVISVCSLWLPVADTLL